MRYFSGKQRLVKAYDSFVSKLVKFKTWVILHTKFRCKVFSSQKTIEFIKETKCSISRYGDGEFDILLKKGNPGFQKQSDELSERLIEIFSEKENIKNFLVCIPRMFVSTSELVPSAKRTWKNWLQNNQLAVSKVMFKDKNSKYIFGDAHVTRPYMDYKQKERALDIFLAWKSVWEEQDLLIVEGEQTKLGIGNDLFSGAKSIKRIIVPAKDAFTMYDDILKKVLEYHKNELVLIAAGPMATVLAYDLARCNVWALDIGHIDIEYEWFLNKDIVKSKVPGKYVNEVDVAEPIDCINSKELQKQIIAIIRGNNSDS